MGFSAKTDEALRGCINTTTNRLQVTGTIDGRSLTPNVITFTANDQNADFSATDAYVQILEGDFTNGSRDLPDATGLSVGWKIEVVNSTSEFTHIYNSDKSEVWHIPPGHIMHFICINIGTAAGGWVGTVIFKPDGDICDCVEFIASSSNIESTEMENIEGSGGLAQLTNLASSTKSQGIALLTPGSSSATGYAKYSNRYAVVHTGLGPISYETNLRLISLSDATDEFELELGLTNKENGDNATHGIVCYYDRPTDGDFWGIKTIDSSTETKSVSTVVPSVSAEMSNELYYEVNSDASRVDFWVNGVHQSSITTNIPTVTAGNTATYLVHAILNKGLVGTGERRAYFDYTRIKRYSNV